MRVVQLEQDDLKYKLRMLQRVAIPEADHAPASSFQMGGSAAIRFVSRNVLPSVKFDDETTLHAREIREVRADRMLTSESVPRQASIPNLKPPAKFGVSHRPSQRACAITGPHTPMLTRTNTRCDWTGG